MIFLVFDFDEIEVGRRLLPSELQVNRDSPRQKSTGNLFRCGQNMLI